MSMNRRSLSSALPWRAGVLALVGLATMACTDTEAADPVAPDPSFAVTQEGADVFETFGAVRAPWGTAILKRGPTGLQARLRVTDPDVHAALAGHAITVWLASFHNPGECAAAPDFCGAVDLGNPDVGAALQHFAGRVLGNGPINLAGSVREGDDKDQIAGTAMGLVDADTDEIHLVIRSHGEPISGKVASQIGTPGGGCKTVNGNPGPDPDGNDCVDVAVAIFIG